VHWKLLNLLKIKIGDKKRNKYQLDCNANMRLIKDFSTDITYIEVAKNVKIK
jgi:hypothetical protein